MTEDVKLLDWEHAEADQYYLVVLGAMRRWHFDNCKET